MIVLLGRKTRPKNIVRYLQNCSFRSFSSPQQQQPQNQDQKISKDNNEQNKGRSILEQLKSPPNIITLTRMASTPVLAYWIISEEYKLAIGGCVLAGLSDALDGYLAKNYNMETTVGAYLDPISDKILINGLAISLWYSGILPAPLILLWGAKDTGLSVGTALTLKQKYNTYNIFTISLNDKPLTVKPANIAKINTALQFTTIWVGIITPVSSLPPMMLSSLCWITGATTVGSVLSYATKSGLTHIR